jgi:hypothetical protein
MNTMTDARFKKIMKIKMWMDEYELECDLYKIGAVVLHDAKYDEVTPEQRHTAKTAMLEFVMTP